MPIAQSSNYPSTVSFTVSDNNGEESSSSLYVPISWGDNATGTFFIDLIDAVEDLTNGRVERGNSALRFEQTDDNITAAPESEIERKLYIPLAGAGNARVLFSVPSCLFTIEQAGTQIISPTNPLVAALIDVLLNGGPLGAGVISSQGVPMTRLDGFPWVGHVNRRVRR